MLLLVEDIFHTISEIVSAAPQEDIFNDIVTPHLKNFSTLNKRKSECRYSGIDSYNYVLGLNSGLKDSP